MNFHFLLFLQNNQFAFRFGFFFFLEKRRDDLVKSDEIMRVDGETVLIKSRLVIFRFHFFVFFRFLYFVIEMCRVCLSFADNDKKENIRVF